MDGHKFLLKLALSSRGLSAIMKKEAFHEKIMCILPNFEARDLEEFKKNGKRKSKKAEAETVEIVIPEQTLENPI